VIYTQERLISNSIFFILKKTIIQQQILLIAIIYSAIKSYHRLKSRNGI